MWNYKMHIATAMQKPRANLSNTVVNNKSYMDQNVVCLKKKEGETHFTWTVSTWNYKSYIEKQ
jgi:hypothetical protein